LLSLVLLTILSLGAEPQARSAAEAIRARVEDLHDAKPPIVGGARLLRSDAVVHFFELRTFEPAWNVSAIDQIRQAIRDVEADGLTPADYHLTAIEALLQQKPTATDQASADLQILLTDAVAALIDDVRFGKVRPVSLDRRWNVDPRAGAPPLETLIAQVASAPSPSAAIEALKPSHFIYTGLKRALADARRMAASGGWPPVPPGPSLKPGARDPRVDAVRKRLSASGDHKPDPPADAAVYDAELEASVKRFQERHRLAADGAIGPATLQAMNVTAAARVDQVRANLERARWVVNGLSDSFVLVNLPAFKAYVIRDRKNVWETLTQIGREARQTPAFRADMRYIVFNPDWTVPPTILSQDVLAGMRRGENTIAKKKLTILDRQGRRVDPSTIDWANATRANFPYTLRQPPGEDNALGRVKFIFPNEHAIFLHDTPSQQLFGQDQRTFSSGCIRVEHALDLAGVLLEGQDDWDKAKIDSTVNAGSSKTVFLKTPLQVLIVYWTVSVGASGEVRFARDVYNRDAAVLGALAR
jgi:murein L,D-transpeptidase YcbB/YkuD